MTKNSTFCTMFINNQPFYLIWTPSQTILWSPSDQKALHIWHLITRIQFKKLLRLNNRTFFSTPQLTNTIQQILNGHEPEMP